MALLTACGSSSSSSDTPSPTPTPPPANGDDTNGDDDDTNGDEDTNGDDDDNDNGNGGGAETPELPEVGDISFRFVDDIDGWHINGTGNTTTLETDFLRIAHSAEQEALVVTPLDWAADNWRHQARYELDEGVNFVDATVIMVVDVPQAYLDDDTLALQLILLGNSGDSYGEPIQLEDYNAETQRIELDLGEREDDISHIQTVAIQLATPPTDNSVEEPIAVRSLDFYLVSDEDDDNGGEENGNDNGNSNEVTLAVDADWSNDGSPASLSYDEGVVITPDWNNQNAVMKVLDETADFTGATVTWVINLPEAYITDGELVVQPYVQQNDDPYASVNDGSIPGGWNSMSALAAGENTIVHGPFDAPPEDIGRVGIWLNPNDMDTAIEDDILIRSVTITFPEE